MYESIPNELRELNQWVGVSADKKIPLKVKGKGAASSTDPNTWCSFAEAVKSVESGRFAYIGFVFADNGIVGIDIDDAFDDEGFLSPMAADIIGQCHSYTEKSKSGSGIHIFVRGNLSFKGKNNLQGVEIYRTARFFVCTGNTLCFTDIIDNQQAIDYICDRYIQKDTEQIKLGADAEPRKVDRSVFCSDSVYNPIWSITDGKITVTPKYPAIRNGCRNVCLTSLAGVLHNAYYSPFWLQWELDMVNASACSEPLTRDEVANIVRSVTKYKRSG